jgi:hypothetical protein
MATRYYSFNKFMDDVIKKADELIKSEFGYNTGLEDLFTISSKKIVSYIIDLIDKGWWVFLGVAGLLLLGPIVFAASIAGFLATPVGLVVGALFGAAAIPVLRDLYKSKELPLAVKEVGKIYKPKWEAVEGNNAEIDKLLMRAAIDLVDKTKKAQYKNWTQLYK